MMQAPPADSVRAVLDSVFRDPAYRWTEHRSVRTILGGWLEQVGAWLHQLQQAHPAAYRAALWFLLAVLLAIAAHAAWLIVRTIGGGPVRDAADPAPAPFVRDQAWCLAEATRLAGLGRYAEAIQLDFLAIVLALDTRRVVHFHPSKTPGEYARELALPADARADFQGLVRTVYGHAFAGWPCDAEAYARWRDHVAESIVATAH